MKSGAADMTAPWGCRRTLRKIAGLVLAAACFVSFSGSGVAAELYIPCCSHHIGAAQYERERPLNSQNTGIGVENDAGYFGMVLKDSLYNPSWAVGKAWRWRTGGDPYIGVGLSAFIMGRKNVGNYTPFPGVLPALTIGTGRIAVDFTVIPKTSATVYGAIFAMVRVHF